MPIPWDPNGVTWPHEPKCETCKRFDADCSCDWDVVSPPLEELPPIVGILQPPVEWPPSVIGGDDA